MIRNHWNEWNYWNGSNRSSCSNRSKRSSRFRSFCKMSLFYKRQGDTAAAKKFVVKFPEHEFACEPFLLLLAQAIDN